MATPTAFLPCPEIAVVLQRAMDPCPNFDADCRGIARWDPKGGHVPRGFVGALSTLADVRLVLVTAEPGDPQPTERYPVGPPQAILKAACRTPMTPMQTEGPLPPKYQVHSRPLLSGHVFAQQLRRAWLVDAYLCSAPIESGSVPTRSARRCAKDYLKAQLDVLPGRAVVALGAKARRRLEWTRHPSIRATTGSTLGLDATTRVRNGLHSLPIPPLQALSWRPCRSTHLQQGGKHEGKKTVRKHRGRRSARRRRSGPRLCEGTPSVPWWLLRQRRRHRRLPQVAPTGVTVRRRTAITVLANHKSR